MSKRERERPQPAQPELVDAHLRRIGVEREPPSVDALRRIGSGRGGYCFHLNGSLDLVLGSLGYRVRRHVGAVWTAATGPGSRSAGPGQDEVGNHLALTVELDGRISYRIEASGAIGPGWRFVHDPAQKAFTAMDFTLDPVTTARFEDKHRELSTSPRSQFVTMVAMERRDATGADLLHGCMLIRQDGHGRHEQELAHRAAWLEAVRDVFGLSMEHVDGPGRTRLWEWLRSSHAAWLATH